MEKQPLITGVAHGQPRTTQSSTNKPRSIVTVLTVVSLLFVISLHATTFLGSQTLQQQQQQQHKKLSVVDQVQQCAIDNLHRDLSFLDTAKPITAQEFIQRRDRLAQALAASEIDAFVLEPGYTFQ